MSLGFRRSCLQSAGLLSLLAFLCSLGTGRETHTLRELVGVMCLSRLLATSVGFKSRTSSNRQKHRNHCSHYRTLLQGRHTYGDYYDSPVQREIEERGLSLFLCQWPHLLSAQEYRNKGQRVLLLCLSPRTSSLKPANHPRCFVEHWRSKHCLPTLVIMQSAHVLGSDPATAIVSSCGLATRPLSFRHECLQFGRAKKFMSLEKESRRMGKVSATGGSTETLFEATSSEEGTKQETKLWGGRFEKPVTPAVERFGQSVSFDKNLYKQDLKGSRAHAQMLAKQGLMTDEDCATILTGLEEIERRIENGEFVWRADREDVHMNIEASLIELVGEPAKKLHTARSRNDQVITDVRLWCRDAIDQLLGRIQLLQVSIVKLALSNEGIVVPGYTHLQRAQPLLLQHLLLAYVEQLERDAGRLTDCRARLNFSPLGSCALAGTGLPIDRFQTAATLGFTAPLRNSVDAVSDRDFLIELLAANSIIGVHMSRLAEEWVLWASEEFGFLIPSDAVSTGSSIMPQKKNPDPMELVRGKSARVIGDLTTVLVLCKGLPQAYNRDLQEDKEPLFDSVATTLAVLEVTAEFAQNVTFNKERLAKSLSAGHLDATTMADYLVYKGIPFRTSHDIVGRSVALALSKRVELSGLSVEEFKAINPIIEEDVYTFLGSENAISKFQSYGSTGAGPVAEQMQFWCQKLGLSK